MSWASKQVDAIDERIDAAAKTTTVSATMASRDTTGSGGTAVFSGSSIAVPVKVAGNVHAFAGDRVAAILVGSSDWVVIACYTRWEESEAGVNSVAGNDSTSLGSYSAISGVPTFTWRKRYDDSRAAFRLSAGVFSAAPPTQVEFAVQLDDGVGGTTDYFLLRLRSDAGGHVAGSGDDTFTGIAAGAYTCTARWKKTTGGAAQLNNIDTVSIRCREIGPLHPLT